MANLLLSHGNRLSNEKGKSIPQLGISAKRFSEIASLIDQNKLAASGAGAVFDELIKRDADPEQIAQQFGLTQVSDTRAIDAAIETLIANNPPALVDFRPASRRPSGRWSARSCDKPRA